VISGFVSRRLYVQKTKGLGNWKSIHSRDHYIRGYKENYVMRRSNCLQDGSVSGDASFDRGFSKKIKALYRHKDGPVYRRDERMPGWALLRCGSMTWLQDAVNKMHNDWLSGRLMCNYWPAAAEAYGTPPVEYPGVSCIKGFWPVHRAERF